jgi:hypothetical protein
MTIRWVYIAAAVLLLIAVISLLLGAFDSGPTTGTSP